MISRFARSVRTKPFAWFSGLSLMALMSLVGALYAYVGWYGLNVFLRRGGTTWSTEAPDSPSFSASMRVAFQDVVPPASPGPFAWRRIADGFEVGELPVLADGKEVDRVLLARVDPRLFRFEVRTAPSGDKNLDAWMADLSAVLVINGSYYQRHGEPDTPLLSDGVPLGPAEYDARHGAFVASEESANVVDLETQTWQSAFAGARDALVSYPMLVAADKPSRVKSDRRWLANRSFVARDKAANIVLGTTTDAFFALDRFSAFLSAAPLDLVNALNLDGGPIACQGVALGDYHRHFCGAWETQTRGNDIRLLSWRFGTWALPIVLAVVRK